MRSFLTFSALFLFISTTAALVKCPDKVSACPDGTTCCPLGDNEYGCCPIPKAVCCEDQRHCCPHDTQCDTAEGKCIQHSTGKKFPIHKKTKSVTIFLDSDGEESAEFGINVESRSHGDGYRHGDLVLSYPEFSAPRTNTPRANAPVYSKKSKGLNTGASNDVTCGDGSSKCPTGTTCCQMGDSTYGCCPIPKAVCCQDHLHCCPHGLQCEVSEGRCVNPTTLETSPWYKKFSATRVIRKTGFELESSRRLCSSGFCLGDETCCSSVFAESPKCCPFTDGVCCTSGTCCPKGYKCHATGCIEELDGVAVTTLKAKLSTGNLLEDSDEDSVSCPDDSECPPRSKCCPVESDSSQVTYKCCPTKNGACCDSTCCPRGYHCIGQDLCERTALSKQLLRELFFDSV